MPDACYIRVWYIKVWLRKNKKKETRTLFFIRRALFFCLREKHETELLSLPLWVCPRKDSPLLNWIYSSPPFFKLHKFFCFLNKYYACSVLILYTRMFLLSVFYTYTHVYMQHTYTCTHGYESLLLSIMKKIKGMKKQNKQYVPQATTAAIHI